MLKLVAVTMSVAVATAGPALAQPTRHASAEYQVPGGVSGLHVSVSGPGSPASYALFSVRAGEHVILVSAADDSGQSVALDVEQDGAELGTFCSDTSRPIRLRGRGAVAVTPVVGPCGRGISAPTSGTIRVTFRP